MNNTLMTIAPLCIVPFSIADFVYNTQCYYEPMRAHWNTFAHGFLRAVQVYAHLNLFVLGKLWLPFLCILVIASIFYMINSIPDAEEEPLTPLEAEVMLCIHRNASTGSTARMVFEEFEREINMDTINITLKSLKEKGHVLKVPGTLWLTSGN